MAQQVVGIDFLGGQEGDTFEVSQAEFQVAILVVVHHQHRAAAFQLGQRAHGALGLMVRQIEGMHHFQLAIANLGGKRRA